MNREYLIKTQQFIRSELDKSLKFWLDNGMDHENGGVYTCLDRTGRVYSTDKSVWMQGRCAWTFAYMCEKYGVRQEWLNASKSCLDFMEKYCINPDADGRMYFQVTDDGKPLRQRRYCFSEGFYAIANAQYYGLTGDRTYLERARRAYKLIYNLNNGLIKDPTGLGSKGIAETRTGRALADPMIFLNITSVLKSVDKENAKEYEGYSKECADAIIKYHLKDDLKCTLETVGLNGEFMDSFTAGRIVNPGHDIECSWFIMEYANSLDNDYGRQLHKDALKMFNYAIEAGWDKEYGGLLYFIDALGNPPEAYEHDMKLWWPHNEILIASMMAYRDTEDQKYLEWFDRTLKYCKEVFTDEQYGEWYGYLRRDGKPTEPSTKGSTFKGPFHLPRSLAMVDKMIEEILKRG